MGVLVADYLTEYSMGVQNVQIFVQFLLLYHPSGKLVYSGLSFLFVNPKIMQKLVFLSFLVDQVDKLVF
jgi:hypothetical protein